MELKHLRYFVAVVEEQSFTKASERLFMAQPPLSRQIQNLEEELGVQLFERGSRPLRATEAGVFLYKHAVKLLATAKEIKAMTQRIGQIERTITFGFVASTIYGLLPKIIHAFRSKHPNMQINFIEMNSLDQMKALKEGKIDIGIGRLRLDDPNIRRILMREEEMVVAINDGNLLIELGDNLSLLDLINQKLIIYPKSPRPSYADQVLALFSEHALKPENILEVRDLQLALGLVAAGEGISIVPAGTQSITLSNMQYLPLNDKKATTPILMNVRGMDQSEEILSFLDCIYEVYDLEKIPYTRESLLLDRWE